MCLLHMVLYAVMSKNGQAVQDAPPQPAAPATHAPKDAAAAGGKPAEATSAPAAQKADRGKAKPVRFDVMEVVNPATVRAGQALRSQHFPKQFKQKSCTCPPKHMPAV